jgi:hypothetical protein
VRILRDIRSESVTLVDHPPGAAASIALVPFSAMLMLCWFGSPVWSGGRWLVTAALGGVIAVVARLAWPRRRTLRVTPEHQLVLDEGVESEDPYRVLLAHGSERALLLEHDDPAQVLKDARSIARQTSAALVGPEWFSAASQQAGSKWQPPSTAVSVVGMSSSGQARAAWATLGGALFTLVVFLVSVKAESGVSLLSAALPLLSVAATALIGAGLATARVHATLGPRGLRVQEVVFGRQARLLDLPAETILGVHAVGHEPYPERHLLIDTQGGLRAFLLAGDAARILSERVDLPRAHQTELLRRNPSRTARDPIAETSP